MGISFISIFILVYHIFFWVCGLAHSLSWDYAPGVPQGDAAKIRVPWGEKPIGGFIRRHVLKMKYDEDEGRRSRSSDSHAQIELATRNSPRARGEQDVSIEVSRRTPHSSVRLSQNSPAQSQHDHESRATPPPPTQPGATSRSGRVLAAIAVVVTPISAIVAVSLLIALVDPLKALFVSFEGGPSWKGPDGKPPLAFVIDTGFSVPLPSSTKLSDRPLATESQTNRRHHRPHDFDPFGCILRSDGRQAKHQIWPSSLCSPIGLCREDDSLAHPRGVRNPGHDNRWFN